MRITSVKIDLNSLSVYFLLGALSYTAPEIFEGGDYSIQSDIYSFGCVLLDMITCDTLTVSHEIEELFRRVNELVCSYRMKKRCNCESVRDMI